MANYLVTGGAGFIGSNLVTTLVARGESVRVVDNFSTGTRANLASVADEVSLVEGDLRDPDICRRAVDDIDYVLHQAAVPSVPRSVAEPLLSHESNVTATVNCTFSRLFIMKNHAWAYSRFSEPQMHLLFNTVGSLMRRCDFFRKIGFCP